jgi:choline dehydrogenase-like flavoprotein
VTHHDVIITGTAVGGELWLVTSPPRASAYCCSSVAAGLHANLRNADLKNEIPIAGVAHQAGTCRYGEDPGGSVLDIDCKAHELDNLYVVDTGSFPSIGAVNPALTAMANSLRVGDHLLERMAVARAPEAALPS